MGGGKAGLLERTLDMPILMPILEMVARGLIHSCPITPQSRS
jgi:hypothetical protein